MGVDADIHFNTKSGDISSLLRMPNGFEIVESYHTFDDDTSPMFFIDNSLRYYAIGYERGHWPTICGVLMELFSNEDVTDVYYNGDCNHSLRKITIEDVLEISVHYMKNGTRPYTQR